MIKITRQGVSDLARIARIDEQLAKATIMAYGEAVYLNPGCLCDYRFINSHLIRTSKKYGLCDVSTATTIIDSFQDITERPFVSLIDIRASYPELNLSISDEKLYKDLCAITVPISKDELMTKAKARSFCSMLSKIDPAGWSNRMVSVWVVNRVAVYDYQLCHTDTAAQILMIYEELIKNSFIYISRHDFYNRWGLKSPTADEWEQLSKLHKIFEY